jgi:hypothetical protein
VFPVSRTFRRLGRLLGGERGIALPLALATMAGTSALATTAISYTTTNAGQAKRLDAEQKALALAEAGLNYAFSTLYASNAPTMSSSLPSEATPQVLALEDGTARYYGSLSGSTWTLVGIGRIRNPSGAGTADIVRRVSGRASVGGARRGTSNNGVWNYIYVDDPTFTTELGNSVDVNIPLYTRGNLRLSNSAQVSGYALQVMGNIEFYNSSHIGTASDPVHEIHVAGGCRVGGSGAYSSPCNIPERVYATISDATTTNFSKPPVNLESWYANAMPGPRHSCTNPGGSFPGGFDGDLVPNVSRGPVDLTPTAPYDCRVHDAAGNLLGQLTWDPSTKALTIAGTVYFDGPIVFSQLNQATYTGRATIYTAGDITFSNSTTLCGDPECDADWDPQQNLLAFVSGGNVRIGNSAKFQGAIYAVNDYSEDNSSTIWGPIIARRVSLANSSVNHYVPIGTLMPGMPASYEDVVTISNEPGSWG